MNPSAIYSKSGKGVQEAGGKTSHLSRPDRAVLSAIDGRATLADVAQKVGKPFDPAFEKLIESLDKGGFIREVSPGQPVAKPAAAAKPGAKGTAPMDAASDLDFTASITAPSKGGKPPPPPQAPPRAAPPPPRPTSAIPPAPPPPSAAEKAKAAQAAKEQQDAMAKAREEAERKAAAERDRVKAEAEAKMRSETEARVRAEADLKAKEAEVKVKAAQEAAARVAADAKARADAEAKKAREEAERARKEAEAEAKRAREEAERARKEAEEKAERARKEAEEKARREQEELKRKLEEERKKLEEERRQREAERKREEEERAQRRIQEERERVERKRREKEEEEERAKRKARDQEEAAEEEKPKAKPKPEPEPARPAPSGGFSDSLLADLESFTNREENEAKERDEAERKAKEEAARRAREAEERRVKEEAERREREEKEREKQRQKEEAAARKQAEENALREKEEREKQRLKEEEEKRKKEADERAKKAKQEESLAARGTSGAGQAAMSEEERLRRRRERQLGPAPSAAAKERAARGGWGKPIAIALFLLLVVAVGVAHIMPIDVADYRQAAEDALGQPVKIGSARLSLISGLQLKFNDVVVGETRIAEVRAFPEFGALSGPRKRFSRIEIDGLKLDQQAFGAAVFAKAKGDNFNVARVVVKRLELVGPLSFPKGLEIDALLDHEGVVRAATVHGPDALLVKVSSKEGAMDVDLSANSFSLPFAPEVTLSKFTMKGTATPRGLSISEWDGQALNGNVSGTANMRWGDIWVVDGVLTARNIYAAVFAPALLSEGRGEGSAKFSMRGEPGKLGAGTRLDGSFTVTNGSLGSIDLSRAIQTGGKQATGRTQFKEMNGQAVYDRGAVAVRNVIINAGQLNAGASADIAPNGALSGRIVADVRVSSQTLRATLNLGGTLKEPQVKN